MEEVRFNNQPVISTYPQHRMNRIGILRLALSLLLACSVLTSFDACEKTAEQALKQSSPASRFAPGILEVAFGAADLTQRIQPKSSPKISLVALVPTCVAVVAATALVFTPLQSIALLADKFGPKSIAIRAPPRLIS